MSLRRERHAGATRKMRIICFFWGYCTISEPTCQLFAYKLRREYFLCRNFFFGSEILRKTLIGAMKGESVMIFDVASSVAFYCRRCGQIHIVDVPYFCGGRFVAACGNCGEPIASLRIAKDLKHGGALLVIDMICGVCHEKNIFSYSLSRLKRLNFEKIYCRKDRFELGYIGRWQAIAQFLDFNTAEYEALHPHEDYNFIGRQQMLLAAINRIHDLAELGLISCACGSDDFSLSVAEDYVVLECVNCGRFAHVGAGGADDLKRIRYGLSSEFFMPALVGSP